MIGESLWSDGTLALRRLPSPYYSVLTPALIGAPLAWLDLANGIQWARLLQALAASLVAVPTYLSGAPDRLDAMVTCRSRARPHGACTALRGFLMTEPLTLTVVTASLLAMARALEAPSMWRYGVFAAWATGAAAVRLQALVLLPAFLVAALIDAGVARDRARLRPLVLLGAVAVGSPSRSARSSSSPAASSRCAGARRLYADRRGAQVESGPAAIGWHAFDVALLGLGLTVLATAALAARALTGHDRDPALRAFLAVTIGYATLLVLQVGLFSAAFVGHVAERYLITTIPPLAIGLCACDLPRRATSACSPGRRGGDARPRRRDDPDRGDRCAVTLVNAPTSAVLGLCPPAGPGRCSCSVQPSAWGSSFSSRGGSRRSPRPWSPPA